MKVLFCASYNQRLIELPGYLLRALKNKGVEISLFDYKKHIYPLALKKALPMLQKYEIKKINQDLIKQAKKFKPDILLVNQAPILDGQTILKIKDETKAITVNWFQDYPKEFVCSLKLASFFDFFFMSATQAVRQHRQKGNQNVRWLPFACDPEIHSPVDCKEPEYKKEICFIGSMYPERVRLLEKLKNFDLGIWGYGWDKLPKDSKLHQFVKGNVVPPQIWREIYSASKIVLNCIGHFGKWGEQFGEEGIQMANMRTFEILGCGGFQVVDKKGDIALLFKPGQDLIFYENPDEAKEIISYFLKHEDERRKIAQSGRRAVLKRHTYKDRLEEIFNVIFS
jgi:spore maturation protein CgeB